MSVIRANELVESPSGTQDNQLTRTYAREWDVYCSSPDDGPKTVMSFTSLPKIGDTYRFGIETDNGSYCSNRTVQRKAIVKGESGDTEYLWTLKADYKTPDKNQNEPNQIDNPLLRPVKIRGGTQIYSKYTQKDKNDKAIKNSAKELFPPSEIPVARFEVEFVKNQASSPANYALFYVNKLNSQTIWGGKPLTWKCQDIAYQLVYEGEYTYYEATYRFQYDRDTHKLKLVDNGYNELVDGNLRPILINGVRATDPVMLNGAGQKAAPDDDPTILEFEVDETTDFSLLGLPGGI